MESEFATLLKSTRENFEIDEDINTFDRIGENLKRIKERRTRQIDENQDVLRSLSRKLELTQSSLESTKNSSAQKQAAEETMQLEREKFALAKSINDLEADYASNLATLEKLKDELEELNNQHVDDEARVYVEDPTILRLKLYRSLGISYEGDSAEDAKKALVRSTTTNNIHVVPLDQGYSDHFVANYIWDKL